MKSKLKNSPKLTRVISRFIQPIALVAILSSAAVYSRAQDCLGNLPQQMRSAVEQNGWKIVQPSDLTIADIKVFKNAHQGQCPGVAEGNFHPKSDKSYVVALIQSSDPKNLQEQLMLVTTRNDQPITEVVVPPAQITSPAVVWRIAPGHYAGVDGKRASISRDSFVYEKVDSTATQFYYQGSHVQSFIISR